jgi:hypothetical protein
LPKDHRLPVRGWVVFGEEQGLQSEERMLFPEIKENLATIYEDLAPSAKKGPFAEFFDKTISSSAF